MSIYPVDFKNDKFWKKYLSDIEFMIDGRNCIVCEKPMNESKEVWAYHAAPQGYACDKVWCSKKCCYRESSNWFLGKDANE